MFCKFVTNKIFNRHIYHLKIIIMRTFKNLFLFLIVGIFSFAAIAQNNTDLKQPIPIDPNVKIGKLNNGIVYYIRKNAKPENRVELRLAVNAGSVLENDDQQGLAHFCEHMCFNGTKNFPKNDLVNTIEKMGIRFGADLNAYTSFDETVYMLKVPTDQPELIDKGIQIIEDWAHNVTFDSTEIDKERGVILEERRLGLGAEDRMRKKSFPVIFKGSKYANRVPIGTKEVLEGFKYNTLRSFYKTWYRPNIMAVVIVGDIDVAQMEQKIIAHFSKISNPANPVKREVFELPDNNEPLISIETDAEATSSNLMFFYKHPKQSTKTIEDYKNYMIRELFTGMLNDRLEELMQKPDAPLVFAGTNYGEFLARSKDAYLTYAQTKENQINQAFEVLLSENERVKRFGFTASEFERQKTKILTQYEKEAKEFDKTESANLAMDYVYNFLAENPIPGAQKNFELAKQFLPQIKIEEINELVKTWISDKNMVIMVTAPKKDEIKVPAADDLLNIIKNVKTKDLKAYTENVSSDPILANIPTGTEIVSKNVNTELDYTEVTFANGVKAILKPTNFKNNEIKISSYSLGGTSLESNDDFITAMFSSYIIDESGISKFNKTDLGKKLVGKDLEISPDISELKQGFRGKCATADLETALQLIYLYYTEPRSDKEAYDAFISKMKSQLMFLANNPQFAFYKKLTETVTQNDPRSIVIPTVEQLEKINLDKAFAFYKERFDDASETKFFFVGNFDTETILPMLQKYLGGLPSKGQKETWKDVNPKFPQGVVEEVVNKGVEEKGFVGLVWSTDFEWSSKNILVEKVLARILDIKLRESVREDEGGTYGLQVRDQVDKFPKSEYSLTIIFGCDPKRQDKLVKVVFDEMEKIVKNGPTEEDMNKIKETLIRERETDLKKNDWWLKKLENLYYYDEPKKSFADFNDNVKAVTNEEVKAAAVKYFNMKNYVKVYLKPEKK